MTEVKRVPGSGKKQLEQFLKTIEGKVAKVGWLDKSAYENGTSVASVAATNEFGDPAKHIPSRPFMRIAISNKKKDWAKLAESGSKSVLNRKSTVSAVMEKIGLKAAGDIRKVISLLVNPPLAARTIQERLKRRADKKTVGNLTKPLIDTGFMYSTLTNSVENE